MSLAKAGHQGNMERQIISFIVFVLLAISVPVLILSGPDWWHRLASALGGASEPANRQAKEAKPPSKEGNADVPAEPISVAELKATPLRWEEIFRFDITPEEIVRRFPRVSVGLGSLELQGYRVPLVTGTRPEDLAGSLTYYFNARGQVELIEFVGTTGAAGPFVSFCHRRFGLAQRITNSPGLFVYEKPHPDTRRNSALVIRPAPVLHVGEEYGRFSLELKLFRDAWEELAAAGASGLASEYFPYYFSPGREL
ncbi:MAG: hypothetical protein NZ899_15265 [Thermoguttaceae bacterium]|nr:hypothetical protein [Thermoguttaceae bacterium]MDW8080213.1 hypothetical protein [Thermoguttaceae bacterium]